MTGHVFGDLMTSELNKWHLQIIFVFKQVQYWMMSKFCYGDFLRSRQPSNQIPVIVSDMVNTMWCNFSNCSWRRHVKLRTISGLLRAEVIYITPAGRKLRTYGEVEKALEVMDTNLTKENFSFSNKLQVGTFYLPCESQVRGIILLLDCYTV